MCSQFHHSKLTLAQFISNFVELKDVILVAEPLQELTPLFLNFDCVEVKNSQLGFCENNLHGVESYLQVLGDERLATLDKDVRETVHHFALRTFLFFVAEKLFTFYHCPVFSELVVCVADVSVVLEQSVWNVGVVHSKAIQNLMTSLYV